MRYRDKINEPGFLYRKWMQKADQQSDTIDAMREELEILRPRKDAQTPTDFCGMTGTRAPVEDD